MEADKRIAIPRRLIAAAADSGARLSLENVPLLSGRTRRLVSCEISAGGWRHGYTVDCGTPGGQEEFEKAVALALCKYAIAATCDSLGDEYFRSRVSCRRSDADVPLFTEARMRGEDVHWRVCHVARLASAVAYGDPNAVLGPRERSLAEQVFDAATAFVDALDDEFEIGRYQAPDAVPADYDGEDYYEDYQKAVDRAVAARHRLRAAMGDAGATEVP